MEKIKVGLLTMSDGREYLHEEYAQLNMDYQREIKEALESTGLFEVTAGDVPVHSNEEAKGRPRSCRGQVWRRRSSIIQSGVIRSLPQWL